MSHIVQIQTEVKDPAAIAAAATRLGLPEPVHGEATLYSGVRSGWRYPLVCDVAAGRIDYDNFEGR